MSLVMLLPILGVALNLRSIFKLNDSSSIISSVSFILLMTYIAGFFGILQTGVYIISILGLLLLGWELKNFLVSKKFSFSFPFLLFLILPVLYWLVHAGSKPIFWDEYSHWGIYIREMSSNHAFYSSDTNAAHSDYPPGTAVWHYYFTLFPGYEEGTVYLAQFILLITPLLVLFENLTLRQWMWASAILILCILGIANFGHGIVSLYTDHQISVWFTGIILQAVLPRKNNLFELGLLALPLSVILLIKDAGLPLAASAVFLIFCLLVFRYYNQNRNLWFQKNLFITLFILVLLPFSFQFSWKLNRSSHGIEAKKEGAGLIRVLLSGESELSNKEMDTYRNNFWKVFSEQQLSRDENSLKFNEFGFRLMPIFQDSFRITLLGLFLIFPFWSLLVLYCTENTHRFVYAVALGVTYFTALAYLFIMYRTYPLIHSVERAQNLVSFLRYAHSITLPMFLIGFGLLVPAFQNFHRLNFNDYLSVNPNMIFGFFLILFIVFETPHIKPFYTTASLENNNSSRAFQWRKDTDTITTQIRNTLGSSKLWVHLPIKDNGFIATVMKYQLTPVKTFINQDPNILRKPVKELANIWNNYQYLWFPTRNLEIDNFLKIKLGNINSRLIKISVNESHISLNAVMINP